MYVVPRPDLNDDPLHAVRLASMAVAAFALIPFVQPAIPPLLVALPVGLMAGMRKAFDPKKAFGGPIAFIVMVWVMSTIVSLTQPLQFLLIAVMGVLYFLGFYLIQKTGNPMGMLLLVVTVLMSVMGMSSTAALEVMRDGFTEACIVAAILIPLLYLIFPPAAKENLVEVYTQSPGPHAASALIRAVVLLVMSFWLYAVIDMSNLMLAVAATFVLVFPTQETFFAEAKERTVATGLGACAAGLILFALTFNAHLPVLLALIFLAGLFFGSRMMRGHYPGMVYQFAFSVTVSLVAGALSTQEPGYAAMSRTLLTLAGAAAAAFATAALEAIFLPRLSHSDQPEHRPA